MHNLPQIDDVIDLVKKKNGFNSDRQLDRELGFKGRATSQWRTKRAWPSDDTMLKLANLADIDPQEALLWLNIWRSEGPTRSIYEQIAERALHAVAVTLVVGGFTLGLQDKTAEASAFQAETVNPTSNAMYIMENIGIV